MSVESRLALSVTVPPRLPIRPSLSSELDLEISRPSGLGWGMADQSRRVYLVFLPIAALYLLWACDSIDISGYTLCGGVINDCVETSTSSSIKTILRGWS